MSVPPANGRMPHRPSHEGADVQSEALNSARSIDHGSDGFAHGDEDDTAPLASILEGHRSVLSSYFRRRAPSREDAEDYVQDVYLRVLSARFDRGEVRSWRGFL